MEEFAGADVLVVGGAGFVGANLVHALHGFGAATIVVVDNLLSAERTDVLSLNGVRFVEGSITDDAILATLIDQFDYAFHLATYHGNQSSIANPLADHENNTLTTLKLFEALHTCTRLRKVVYASAGCTVAEKGVDRASPTSEDALVALYHDSPYQISKIIGELYANYYFAQHRLPVVKARFQNVYGPGEILGAGRWRGTPATVWRNVTPTFIYRGLKQTPIVIDNGGTATRDFIFVTDIVEGLLRCAAIGGAGEVYNLASGEETSIRELAETINELTGNPAPIEVGPARPWDHSTKRYGSTVKSRRSLGFETKVPLREGLQRSVVWTRDNLEMIDRAIARHSVHMGGEVSAGLLSGSTS